MQLLSCPDSIANFLGFLDPTIAPKLLFYAYLPILVLSLFVGFLVFSKDKHSLKSKLFLGLTVSFAIWILLIVLQWIAVHVQIVHFAWQILALFEALIFLLALYFVYVYLNDKDVTRRIKQIAFIPIAAFLVLIPTELNIAFFDFEYCEGTVGILWQIIYFLEVICIAGIVGLGAKALRAKNKVRSKKEIVLLVFGVSFFLALFSASNIVGEITQVYEVNLFGPIGMVVFLSMLGYMIARFSSFNVRVLGAQVLVFALGFLTFALIFIRKIENVQIIAICTLVLVTLIGRVLIRGVRREVEQRKRLEQLTTELATANEKLKSLDRLKTEFLSLASHQLRSPLTAIKGYASMLDEGTFGKLTADQDVSVKRIYSSAQGLANLVEDLLNVSKIEQGGMQYEMMPTDLVKAVTELADEMRIPAESKKLELRVNIPEDDRFMINADPTKIAQVFLNLVDNSIKYTKEGFVELALSREGKNIIFTVRDSGMGMDEETKGKIFQKFSRGTEGGKVNTGGSGLGLYLAQQIVKAHKGEIKIESDGIGKGSLFKVVLPEGNGKR